jgi:methionine aminopeptidase
VQVIKTVAALSLLSLFFTQAADAVSVKNLDEADHTFTVVEGASSQDLSLKPGASVNGICLNGCKITLSGDPDTYKLEGGEVTSIENGVLWGDDVIAPAAKGDSSPGGALPDKKP